MDTFHSAPPLKPSLALPPKVAIEPNEPGEEKDREVVLFLDFFGPIPRRRESPVDARSPVVTGAIETVAEKVAKDHLPAALHAAELAADEVCNSLVLRRNLVQRVEHSNDWRQDSSDLRVLVDVAARTLTREGSYRGSESNCDHDAHMKRNGKRADSETRGVCREGGEQHSMRGRRT